MIGNRLKIANIKALKAWHKRFPDHSPLVTPGEYDGVLWSACLGKYRKTKVFCSRFCCGNPRKHWGELTPQEKKAPRMDEWI